MASVTIRALQPNDFPEWLPLWDANNLCHRNEAVTTETWSRLMDAEFPVHGICAIHKGELAGIIQYVLHPTTGAVEPVCYMQDVFVSAEHRGKGIARKMVQDLVKIGRREKWARMYWLADAKNEAAQALYKNIGVKLDFTLHIQPLD